MEKVYRQAQKWLVGAIILMLMSMVGASLIQTSGGRVDVTDLRWETSSGVEMSGLLFVPHTASSATKAPAIVVSHGMYNNREMQDLNFVELARRGYVVLSMDMYSHGWSGDVADIATVTTGMYQAVKMISGLEYVDTSRIGITGHSLGGMSSNVAVQLDNAAGTKLISAVLLNSADATYIDAKTKQYTNIYGSRDVGIIAGQYDEFFFKDVDSNGQATAPRDFVRNANAQSFLSFGTAPSASLRVPGTMYRQSVDGQEAVRVIYNPAIIHPWSHFSAQSTAATIDFFEEALGAPNPIASHQQVWQWKVVFNVAGLIGFGIFLVSFTILMLHTRLFESLRAREIVRMRETSREGRVWFWATLVATAVVAAVVYLPILTGVQSFTTKPDPWPQSSPYGIAMWALACGAVTATILSSFYFFFMRKNGIGLAERGIIMSWAKLGKTVLLSLIVVTVTYGCVFVADYFFKTDFRIWVLAVKAFPAKVIGVALFPPLVLFTIFYVMASIAANSINFIRVGRSEKEREWVNTTVLAAFNVAPVVVLLLIQYITFFVTGFLPLANMQVVWLFPLLVILPVTTIVSRKLYRVTNNPYLGGIITAAVVTLIACSNTLTWAV